MNDIDRFRLSLDVIARIPASLGGDDAPKTKGYCLRRLEEHRQYIREHGDDMPDVRDWRWPANTA